jgi:hypothetical protein
LRAGASAEERQLSTFPDFLRKSVILPALLEKKYLKTICKCHECAVYLEEPVEGLSVLNLDFG